MKNFVKLVILILILNLLIGCTNKNGNTGLQSQNNGVQTVNNMVSKEIKDISDDEILQTVREAYSLYEKIHNSFDINDSIDVDMPSGSDNSAKISKFYRITAPYETPEKRANALKSYFVNNNLLSEIVSDKSQNASEKLIKKGDSYYFCALQLQPRFWGNYEEVVKKHYADSKLLATLKYDWGDEDKSYTNIEFAIDENQLKINNIYDEKESIKKYNELKSTLSNNISNIFSKIQGNYSISFSDLSQDENLSINNEKVPAASVIKIYIMIEAFKQIKNGNLSLSDKLVLNESVKAGGSGVLAKRDSGSEITIEELIELMMTESDNTAANMLIDKLGMSNINSTIKTLGCTDTELNRKMMDVEATNNGIENYVSVNDLNKTFKKIYNNDCIDDVYDNKMLDIMKRHQLKSKIPNQLPPDVVVAHKSGEMNGIENDAGIIYTEKGAYILCLLTRNGKSNEQVNAISEISRQIYNEYINYKK